jgi:hypothetical protein
MTSPLVLAGFIVSDQVTALKSLEPFTVAKKSEQFVQLSTIYFSLSVATSLTTTFLITLRILLVQRMSKKTGTGSHRSFNPIMEILVESAVLYSVSLLTFVVLDVKKDINVYYAQNIHAQMAVRYSPFELTQNSNALRKLGIGSSTDYPASFGWKGSATGGMEHQKIGYSEICTE